MERGEMDGLERKKKSRNVWTMLFCTVDVWVCVCFCVNIHHMSIFITLSETGLFFHLRVQRRSPSLLPLRSHGGIITSYFFVNSMKTTALVRKLGEKSKAWHMTSSKRTQGQEKKQQKNKGKHQPVHVEGRWMQGWLPFGLHLCSLEENMIMTNWLPLRNLQQGHCRTLCTVPWKDTKESF